MSESPCDTTKFHLGIADVLRVNDAVSIRAALHRQEKTKDPRLVLHQPLPVVAGECKDIRYHVMVSVTVKPTRPCIKVLHQVCPRTHFEGEKYPFAGSPK